MRDPASTPFIGLDVGTSAVRCVVGMADPANPNKLSVVGHGSSPNLGMRRGVVVHIEDVTEAIVQALTEAERVSGMRIHAATVNVNGAHVGGMNSKGVIAISAANREITPEDRMRVEEAATIVQLPSNREIIQVFAKNYRLDGQENIKDPVGMNGVRLEVDTHIVTAATPNLRNLDMALERAQVAPNNHTLSSLAAAEAVLDRQQKEAGTVLIDIGAGTTNIVVLEDGEVQHVAVLPIGGMHITNDLAIGLKTDLDVAEAVKIRYAALGGEVPKRDVRVRVHDQDHLFKAEEIAMITEARVEELFEYIQKELSRIHRAQKLPGGVVLVGGTAKLPGVAEFAKDKMQLAARVGKLRSVSGLVDTVADPAYATAVGLMILDMLLVPEVNQPQAGNTSARALKMVDDLWNRFKR
ncbi:MAG TPA: cell division protein FtsA [Candidatus Saccharimonadales bacterium]|nr:cell division protein FtsA [Candidatus Saccharimonadales bacterium]